VKALKWSREKVIAAVALTTAAAVACRFVPKFIAHDRRCCCLANLKQIDGAIVSVSLENRLFVGDPAPLGRVAEVLKGGRLPNCPSGGQYVIGLIGDMPVCSYHGNLLNISPPTAFEVSTNIPTKWFLFREVQSPLLSEADLTNLAALATRLQRPTHPIDRYVRGQLSPATVQALANYEAGSSDLAPLQAALLKDLNNLIRGPLLHDDRRFAGVRLRTDTALRLPMRPQGDELVSLNRLLLEDAYPVELRKAQRSPK